MNLTSFQLLLAIVITPWLVSGMCECGYSVAQAGESEPVVFMDLLETAFTEDHRIVDDVDWVRQQFNVSVKDSRGPYGKAFVPENIATTAGSGEPGIQLRVGSDIDNGNVPAAELDTSRMDLHWGSYRAGLKLTAVSGTCAAFFWYFNDTQEIDVEFLSHEFDRQRSIFPVHLVVQSRLSMEAGFDASKTGTYSKINLDFDPTAGFHEYRFDYVPGNVKFYTDSKLVAQMNGSAMPTTPGHLILQHWSNGNDKWSGGPPKRDAALMVSYVKAYFNSSEPAAQEASSRLCQEQEGKGSGTPCLIPDVAATNASTGGKFFTEADEERRSGEDFGKLGPDDKKRNSVIGVAAWIDLWLAFGCVALSFFSTN